VSVVVGALWLGIASSAAAQPTPPTGHLSIFFDRLPTREATELRARAFVEEKAEAGKHVRVTASGFVEGLVADRGGRVTDAIAEPQDLSIDVRTRRVDLTLGFTRVVWGRLDELQPTDVVNPLDLSRFFFEGRSEARLAVPLTRVRVYAGEHASLEALYVPAFRRGRFDRLDEPSSPFNLVPRDLAPTVPLTAPLAAAAGAPLGPVAGADHSPVIVEDPPARTLGNAQGGARLNATSGRIDWSVSAFRGFRPFGLFTLPVGGGAPAPVVPVHRYPRFTMVGADMESVAGEWGVRAELAAFVEDALQVPDAFAARDGRSFDAGAGLDRKAGDYRISASLLVHHERAADLAGAPAFARTDTSLIVAADRMFARERYQGRLFAVYTPSSEASFVRGILTAKLRDNVAAEGSIGWFAGRGADTIGRFADRDFGYLRVKYYF
jgi:hypothetical protein